MFDAVPARPAASDISNRLTNRCVSALPTSVGELRRLLQWGAHAPCTRQGYAAPSTCADSRACRISHLARRSPSALCSDGIIGRHSHICEVEIDPDTGALEIVRYAVVDDVGTVVNPIGLKGQIHGGVAQGLGQALMEQVVYDRESGQNLTGSFMDYCMPRADAMPYMEISSNPVPTKRNPLGAKGAGEAGTVGALPAIINAVMDALAPLGAKGLDMPATSERIWQVIRAARA